jgi:hypothetical protein
MSTKQTRSLKGETIMQFYIGVDFHAHPANRCVV